MLATHPVRRKPHFNSPRRARASLRIFRPIVVADSVKPVVDNPKIRTGEVQPIGRLMPQVLARYLAPSENE